MKGQTHLFAVDFGTVNNSFNQIQNYSHATADVALPIGLAVVGLGVLAMILRRFIMV